MISGCMALRIFRLQSVFWQKNCQTQLRLQLATWPCVTDSILLRGVECKPILIRLIPTLLVQMFYFAKDRSPWLIRGARLSAAVCLGTWDKQEAAAAIETFLGTMKEEHLWANGTVLLMSMCLAVSLYQAYPYLGLHPGVITSNGFKWPMEAGQSRSPLYLPPPVARRSFCCNCLRADAGLGSDQFVWSGPDGFIPQDSELCKFRSARPRPWFWGIWTPCNIHALYTMQV